MKHLAVLGFALCANLIAGRATAAEPPSRPPPIRNVAIVLYEGVEVLDFAGPTEVFATAAHAGARRGQPVFRVFTVARDKKLLTSQGVVKIAPEFSIDDAPHPDLIVIPGGNSGVLVNDPQFMAWAQKAVAGAEISMSVCSGAFVLGKVGVLDGHDATTWYGAIDRLRHAVPKARVQNGRRFIDEGRVITTAGVSAGIDGALHVVARLLGRSVADHTARYMEYHWTPEPYLAESYPLLDPSLDEAGQALQRADLLEEEKHFAEAARLYREVVEKNSQDGWVWTKLASALQQAGDVNAAHAAEQRASSLNYR